MPGLNSEQYFYLHDGRTLKDLQELTAALETMDADLFRFHCNEERNDFAAWVRGVFHASAIADAMQHAQNREELFAVLKTPAPKKEQVIEQKHAPRKKTTATKAARVESKKAVAEPTLRIEEKITAAPPSELLSPLEKTALMIAKDNDRMRRFLLHDTFYSFIAGVMVGVVVMVLFYQL
ncbi:hypothetical protein HZB01_00405 [Candidatus Woesearchaeota archaeon]|nr:hypothetical protein [Candidatus Woesearchaeota archaeon]